MRYPELGLLVEMYRTNLRMSHHISVPTWSTNMATRKYCKHLKLTLVIYTTDYLYWVSKHLQKNTLACSGGVFWVRECIFVLGHHLGFGNCGGLGRGIQSSTGQASNYNPRWRHRKTHLSSVLLQNNACTAG